MLNKSKVEITACSGSWRSGGETFCGSVETWDNCLNNGLARVLDIDRAATVLVRNDMMVVGLAGRQ